MLGIISIHVLREEDDLGRLLQSFARQKISIHVLREEDDFPPHCWQATTGRFQSTSSARRTTPAAYICRFWRAISIHVLREEDDANTADSKPTAGYFNPRPPRGGRPGCATYAATRTDFNPRPPRGGRASSSSLLGLEPNFNPRPPRGGRADTSRGSFDITFQSTSSARRTA